MSTACVGGVRRGRERGEEEVCWGNITDLASLFRHTLLFKLAVRSSRIAPRYLSTCRDMMEEVNLALIHPIRGLHSVFRHEV